MMHIKVVLIINKDSLIRLFNAQTCICICMYMVELHEAEKSISRQHLRLTTYPISLTRHGLTWEKVHSLDYYTANTRTGVNA